MILGNEALAQLRNDRLFNDIVSGGVNELSLSLAAGIDPNTELLVSVPGSGELAVSLIEIAMSFQNDDAAAQLLQVGARVDPLVRGRSVHYSPLGLFARQGMLLTLTTYIDRDNSVLIENGGDAFLEAVAFDQMPAAQLVLNRTLAIVGPNEIQAQLDEALVIVAGKNNLATTQMLLERGADPGSGAPLIVAVAKCSPDTVAVLLGYSADALPYYDGEHLASYAQQCFTRAIDENEESEENAVDKYSQIVQLLYEADPTICPVLVDVKDEEISSVISVLQNLDLCQEVESVD
jgi:hypothetical protein